MVSQAAEPRETRPNDNIDEAGGEPSDSARLSELVRDVPDWPTPGVLFKDITPLLADGPAFTGAVSALTDLYRSAGIDKVLGVEARGFIFAAPVAHHLGAGFVPVRKAGKLPWHIETQHYDLEYGTDLLEIHRDALRAGERVLIVDDVLATGGTAAATAELAERLGATVIGLAFVLELAGLAGRNRLGDRPVASLVSYR
jgi:adenine phosphoribosyltransferase